MFTRFRNNQLNSGFGLSEITWLDCSGCGGAKIFDGRYISEDYRLGCFCKLSSARRTMERWFGGCGFGLGCHYFTGQKRLFKAIFNWFLL